LRQPDADTLVVISSDPVVDVKEMHRSRGEFSCGKHGLERTLHASLSSLGSNADSSAPHAALCIAGMAVSCSPADNAPIVIDRLTLNCVRLSASSYGYYGRETR
jgi:hypothetical protein